MKKVLVSLIVFCAISVFSLAQSLPSVSILGDSYSTFEGYVQPDTNALWYFNTARNNTDVTSVQQTWWHLFVKNNGYRLSVNNSFSGSTICNTGYRKEDYSDRSFIKRMDNLGNPDVLFVFGATNDAWAGAPIGAYQYENWSKADLYQFRPAMAYMLNYLVNRYPNVKIYFLLNSELKESINESVKTICAYYKVDCISLKDIDKRGSHPSIQDMQQISDQIAAYISKAKQINGE